MQNEVKKKPPAHEVIVQELLRLEAVWRKSVSPNPEGDPVMPVVQAYALISVLVGMHIPEGERAKIVAALRALPTQFFPPMIVDVFTVIEGDGGSA